MNLRPSGYEPDELPGCSTPRQGLDGCEEGGLKRARGLGWPGGDRLSRALRQSTMGAEAVDGRVRDGIGSGRLAKATRPAKATCGSLVEPWAGQGSAGHCLMRAIKPNERLVPVSCTHCCASTSGLSTWSSSTALQGALVSRWVSRLDAFSGYPVRP